MGLRPRGAGGVVPIWKLVAWDPRRANVSVQVWRQKKSDVPPLRQPGSRNSTLLERGSAFLFCYLGLQLIGWGPPTLRRGICFIQNTNSNANLIQEYPYRHTQNNVWPNVWATYGLVKLTHKVNHHAPLHLYLSYNSPTAWANSLGSFLLPSLPSFLAPFIPGCWFHVLQ